VLVIVTEKGLVVSATGKSEVAVVTTVVSLGALTPIIEMSQYIQVDLNS